MIALVGNDALLKNTNYDVNAQAWLTIDLVKGLSWHTKGAVRLIAEREKEWRPLVDLYNYHTGEFMNNLDVGAKGLNSNDYHTFYTYLYSYLKYDFQTSDRCHNFNFQLGYSQESNNYDWLKGYRKDFAFPMTELDAGSEELQEASGNLEQWSLMGILGVSITIIKNAICLKLISVMMVLLGLIRMTGGGFFLLFPLVGE